MAKDNHLFISNDTLEAKFGWQLKPEGLCRDEICIPVRNRDEIETEDGLKLNGLARLWHRPLAVNQAFKMAYMGDSAQQRSDILLSGEAPDFTLPDVYGGSHSLSDFRGQKIFLIAYASW